jgi:2-polyprenyl-6-methoxyphenol hydroxylase-like FAD-dependent oxidoreductase
MASRKTITIIGGGLAGLSLGLALRRRQVPVTLCEAGTYPRHRVCGEFISGRGIEVLSELQLIGPLLDAGAVEARTSRFISERGSSPVRRLSQPALCLSRYRLDALLAETFEEQGGELHERERCTDVPEQEALVHASGRRARPMENRWRWFGLKIHARNLPLSADLEMHVGSMGYVGLCRLKDNRVNICGLFRRRDGEPQGEGRWRDLLRNATPSLAARMGGADLEEHTFCAVAGLSLQPQRASAQDECRIGDALTMIPPVTGNGMSMAFESAAMAVGPLSAYSRGEIGWDQARKRIAGLCDTAFATRLKWARWLQAMMFAPVFRTCIGSVALSSHWLWQTMWSRTR